MLNEAIDDEPVVCVLRILIMHDRRLQYNLTEI
jgi:hypothetical protein